MEGGGWASLRGTRTVQIAAYDDDPDTGTDDDDLLLTTHQVARIFQKTPKTIRRWLRAGVLDGHRIGRDWYVTPAAIDRMVARTDRATLSHADVIDLRRRLRRFTERPDSPA